MSDPRKLESADVYREAQLVGSLTRTKHGAVFEYSALFFEAHRLLPGGVALHFPYRRKRHVVSGINLHPYFAGLLPEGLRLRALIQRAKTSEDDLFSLLVASGSDTIGDLSVVPQGQPFEDDSSDTEPWKPHEVVFKELLAQSLFRTKTGLPEPVVPGVQEKLSTSTISIPLRPAGRTSYILKLNPPKRPRLVENEAFFMQMASDCRLDVANTRLVKDRNGESGLLVERFDRVWLKSEKWLRRVHQEDACQFLDRYPADKYRISCTDIADGIVETVTAPAPELLRFLQLVAFSYVIANGDLHGKNVSVLAANVTTDLRLSPAYDLLTTLPYGDQRMALKLNGRDSNLTRRHFVEFGARFQLQVRAITRMLDELIERAKPWVSRLEEIGFEKRKTTFLRKTMTERIEDLG